MSGPTFTPVPLTKVKPEVYNLRIELTQAEATKIRHAAADSGVSMRVFGKQAIAFALEHMERPK